MKFESVNAAVFKKTIHFRKPTLFKNDDFIYFLQKLMFQLKQYNIFRVLYATKYLNWIFHPPITELVLLA